MRKRRAGSIFSEARFGVLRTLYLAGEIGVSLREISYRSELSVGSVQAALRSLRRLKLVRARRDGRRELFTLNDTNPDFSLLSALFERAAEEERRNMAERDSARNKKLLEAVAELQSFARKVKEARREA